MSRHTIPRHQAIERHLRSRVAGLQPGDPLESDAELCALFRVSRMTVRQAAQRLADEGLIYRVPGVGTFVAEPKVHRDVGRLRSFTEEMALRGAAASSRLLVSEIRSGTHEEIAALQLPPRAKVTHVRRLRLADGKPMAIEDVVLPVSCAAVLNEDLEQGSLHEALQRLGEIPTRATGTQVAALAGPDDAKLLSIKVNAALLIERRLITNQNGLPLEKTETRYVGDEFVFHIVLSL
ncbi:GntR family transcriptional regulator [Planosporangium thailandense]|uniref:GntR family transcriptional regulator n=1 Tax=Planosporangium thailandense TaxID=765197 RepID=A0ABX0Y3E8_9ACTN|nr:GntR family transcriptional regulator [Planosporangium thailandense]NJC72915.1 GntR family transcriptional regulator [Planosporangium thailandense]